MCKLKGFDARPLRFIENKENGTNNNGWYTAFEVDVLKAANDANVVAGSVFSHRSEVNGFDVVTNDENEIRLIRKVNGKELKALKVVDGAPVTPRPVRPAAPAPAAAPAGGDAVTNAVNALLQAVEAQKAAAAPAIDENAVRALVADAVAAECAKIEKAHTTRLVVNGAPCRKLDGKILHPQFKKILKSLAKKHIPYLYGPAGTGKTTAAKQAAEALGLPFYCVGALQSKYEMDGFIDAKGDFQSTVLYKAMVNGGVYLFDEIDSTTAEVLVPFNAIMANGYHIFPNGEMVMAHKDFRIACAGNTVGRGADESYCGRFQLDSSTLDRFGFIEMDYCKEFDMFAAINDENIVSLFNALRTAIKKQHLTYTASPRGIARVIDMITDDDPWSDTEALSYGLCGSWAAEDIKLLQNNVVGSGRWFTAFKAL